MEDKKRSSGLTIGIGTVVFIVFLILKLTKLLNISWFWVFFPLWIPVAVSLLVGIIAFIILLIKTKSKK